MLKSCSKEDSMNREKKFELLFHITLAGLVITLITLPSFLTYLPGDVQIERFIQSIIPNTFDWAKFVMNIAEFPYYFILLIFAFLLGWIATNSVRIASFIFVSFFGIRIIDNFLRIFICQPRPTADLVNVHVKLHSSAFPSTTSMVYASIFGFLVGLVWAYGFRKTAYSFPVFVVSVLALILCFIDRVVMGAHWPSDVLISYVVSFAWVYIVIRYMRSQWAKHRLHI